jgi:casein kinase II subunit alpha
VLGTEEFEEYLSRYEIRLKDSYQNSRKKYYKKISFEDLIPEGNEESVTEEALDLLSQMLKYDHDKRITPREAL